MLSHISVLAEPELQTRNQLPGRRLFCCPHPERTLV